MTHLTDTTIQLLAEGRLDRRRRAEAERHLAGCVQCAESVAAERAVIEALEAMPAYEPSAAFADAVMARVVIAPRRDPVPAWLRRLLPATPRGWRVAFGTMAVPAVLLLGLIATILSTPGITLGSIARWTGIWLGGMATAGLERVVEVAVAMGALDALRITATTVQAIPLSVGLAAIAIVAVVTSLATLTLVQVLRTPRSGTVHAH
jgi:anti-sigma factor RsiW